MSVPSTVFRLQVWKPCRWDRQYLSSDTGAPATDEAFQECIYVWEPLGDPFACITAPEETRQLRDALIEAFAPGRPVGERAVEGLQKPLDIIDRILNTPGIVSWADSPYALRTSGEEVLHLRQHMLLALRQHLQWVLDIFKHAPRVSVTVR